MLGVCPVIVVNPDMEESQDYFRFTHYDLFLEKR